MVVAIKRMTSIPLCLLLVIGVLGVTGCSKPKSSYDYLTQARHERQKGNDQAALIDLKNALKKDPKNGEARFFLAQILNEHGQGSAAEIELRKAIDLGLNKSYVAAAMGQALLLQQKYQRVIDNINVAAGDKGKIAADIYNVRGNAYLALGKTDEAASSYKKALNEYADSADAYLGMARLAAMQNDLDGALQQTDIALSKDPNSTMGWLMKAVLLRAENKDEEARTAYNHIIQTKKSNVTAHLGLASIDMAQNKLDAAKVEVDAALKIAPKDLMARYELGLVEFQRGKFKEAQDAVQEVLKSAPDHLPSTLLRGAISFTQGSYEQALSDIGRVVARYPGNAYARRLLAATQFKLGESGHALETLQPLLKPELADAQALALAGEVQLKARNYDKATEYLQKALEIDPQAQKLKTQLAVSRLGAGDVARGMSELEEAAKQAPGQSPADMMLIVTHLNRKEYDQALAAISNLEKKLGSNPVTSTLRGTALFGKLDFAGSRKAFEKALADEPTYFPAAANLAQLDLRDNKPDAARKHLEAVLEIDKNNVQAMMALAELAANQNKEQEYVTWLERAREAKPNAFLPLVKLADYYLAKKEKAKALSVANEAVIAYPNSPKALGLLGATQLAAGENEDALKTYTILVEKAPKVSAFYLQLAVAQSALKKLNDARASLNKALELQPDYQQARDALIRLDLAENKEAEALKIARQEQAQQPKSPLGYDTEAEILMVRKQYVQAINAYEQALARGAGSSGLIKLHRALIISKDERAAEQRLTSWIKKNPKDVTVRAYAADYYMSKNRNKDAISQYEELLKLEPQSVVVLNNLANLYQREKDSRALSTAEQALKLAPNNPKIQDTLGWILVEQEQFTRAIELLRKAVSNVPKEGAIRYHLAVALAHSGQKAEAKKEVEAAIATGQKFSELDDAKGLLKGL